MRHAARAKESVTQPMDGMAHSFPHEGRTGKSIYGCGSSTFRKTHAGALQSIDCAIVNPVCNMELCNE